MPPDETLKPSDDKTLIRQPTYTFPDWTGKDLGEYTVDKRIAEGGMSVVYQGTQKGLDRKVAIKVLPPTLSAKENFQTLFKQEARVLASLSHPNIIPIYSYGQFETCPYFAMEFIFGETLKGKVEQHKGSFFKRKTILPIPEVLRWIRQITLALDYAHEKGVIHCDVKPSNILIDNRERLFVGDFGLVHMLQAGFAEFPCGTPPYMSCEQARGAKLDIRTDIYSLGCVLYELLTGKSPSEATTVVEALEHFDKGGPTPPSRLLPSVPLLLDQIIMKALEINKDKRYQTMAEFRAVLDQFTSGKLQARLDQKLRVQPASGKRSSNRISVKSVALAIVSLAVLAAAVVMGIPWLKKQQASREKAEGIWCASQWQIAQNYLRNNMQDLGIETYQKILQRYPKHPVAEQARKELLKYK